MGANAQTAVPAFTAGQVLTAAQQTQINTGIPVFADTTARDAAFGGTGEKVLAEGQFAYIEASNTTQYYDGAAWQTMPNGLTFIKAQTIGSAVSSVTVSDAFSATYDNYMIIINGGVASGNVDLKLTLGATATGYYYGLVYAVYTSSTAAATVAQNQTSWVYAGSGSTDTLSFQVNVSDPFATKRSIIRGILAQPYTTGAGGVFGGYLADNTSYTAFTITTGSGTMTGGTIRVYGYQNS